MASRGLPAPTSPEGIRLEHAEFFRALGPTLLARVRPHIRERRLARQELLYLEGERAESLWALRSGAIRLYKTSADGRVTTIEVLQPGEIFGAMSALDDQRYQATAEAVEHAAAWVLPRSTFLRLLETEPALAHEVLGIIAQRLHAAHERLRSFAHDPAPARLARELLRAARAGEACVTRRALAEAAGTTVETAIRVLRGLHRQGMIRGGVRRIAVLDQVALRRLAGELSP